MNYLIKGAAIGGLIGLVGSILRPIFHSMNHDPFVIFAIPGILLGFSGLGDCDWKRGTSCELADFTGSIITIIICALLGLVIGLIIAKVKQRT